MALDEGGEVQKFSPSYSSTSFDYDIFRVGEKRQESPIGRHTRRTTAWGWHGEAKKPSNMLQLEGVGQNLLGKQPVAPLYQNYSFEIWHKSTA